MSRANHEIIRAAKAARIREIRQQIAPQPSPPAEPAKEMRTLLMQPGSQKILMTDDVARICGVDTKRIRGRLRDARRKGMDSFMLYRKYFVILGKAMVPRIRPPRKKKASKCVA